MEAAELLEDPESVRQLINLLNNEGREEASEAKWTS